MLDAEGHDRVDRYLASLPDETRRTLELVRAAIREGAPEAEECISYNMPAYRLKGLMLYFAAFKTHYSLFCPQPAALLAAFERELAPYQVSKSTIRFPLDEPAPVEPLRRIARHRAEEFGARPPALKSRPRRPQFRT